MADWFFRTKSGEEGPFRPAELMNLAQQGGISRETPLRRSDSDQWVPARRLKGLFPPEIPSEERPPAANRSSKKWNKLVVAACSVVVLFIVGLLALPLFTQPTRIPPQSASNAQDDDDDANSKIAQTEVMTNLERSRLKAEEVVKLYLAAKTWDERLPLMTNLNRKPQDSPLTAPGTYSPAKITASMTRNFDGVETTEIDVDISTSHPGQPSLAFDLIPTPEGYKIDANLLLRNAVNAKETLEAARRAEETRLRMARAEQEPPADGTEEFKEITTFPERYMGRRLYISGLLFPSQSRRNKEFKCFSLRFALKSAVDGGPWRDSLSFITTEELGAALLKMQHGDFHATVHVKLRYLDPNKEEYPVGDVSKIELFALDLNAVKHYKAFTLHADGTVQQHANPFR
jgi:hypothetical protein